MFSTRTISLLLLVLGFGCTDAQPSGSVSDPTSLPAAVGDADLGWLTIETECFECTLPANWKMSDMKKRGDAEISFDVIQPDATVAFTITVAIDRPRFIECYCTGWDAYDFYTRDGIEYANVYMDENNLRTLKAKGSRYATDVHVAYKTADRETTNRIVESVHPY